MTDLIKSFGTAYNNGYSVVDEFGMDISKITTVIKVANNKLAVYDEFDICITKRVKVTSLNN